MEKQDYFLVELKIHEFECTIPEISNILQLEPTYSWKKGDLINSRTNRVYKHNAWCLGSSLSNEEQMADHVKNLFEKIIPKIGNFKNLPKECYIELSIYIKKYTEGASLPVISFSKEDIEILYKIGANVDFDIYALNEN